MEKKYARPINDDFYTEEDVQKIGEHFDKYMRSFPCPVCKHTRWGLSKALYTGTIFHLGKDKHWHGKVDLRIKANCQKCGYIVEFDADKAGILPRRSTEITIEVEDDAPS